MPPKAADLFVGAHHDGHGIPPQGVLDLLFQPEVAGIGGFFRMVDRVDIRCDDPVKTGIDTVGIGGMVQ